MSTRASGWFRLPPKLLARLHDEAEERGVSVNWLVTKLLEESLEIIVPAADFRLTR